MIEGAAGAVRADTAAIGKVTAEETARGAIPAGVKEVTAKGEEAGKAAMAAAGKAHLAEGTAKASTAKTGKAAKAARVATAVKEAAEGTGIVGNEGAAELMGASPGVGAASTATAQKDILLMINRNRGTNQEASLAQDLTAPSS